MNRSYIIALLVTAALCIVVISRHLTREEEQIASSQLRRPWQTMSKSEAPASDPTTTDTARLVQTSPVLSRQTTSTSALQPTALQPSTPPLGHVDRTADNDIPSRTPAKATPTNPTSVTTLSGNPVRTPAKARMAGKPAGTLHTSLASDRNTKAAITEMAVDDSDMTSERTRAVEAYRSNKRTPGDSPPDRTSQAIVLPGNASNNTSHRPREHATRGSTAHSRTTATQHTVQGAAAKDGTPYVVRPGDTYSSIAVTVYGDQQRWLDLQEANPTLSPMALHPGQKITVPRTTHRRTTLSRQENRGRAYTIRPGDTLSSIAARHYGNSAAWSQIYNVNRQIIGPDPDVLSVGTQLQLNAATR